MIDFQLSKLRYRRAYVVWLKTAFAGIPVAINDRRIPARTLKRAIDVNVGVNDDALIRTPVKAADNPMWHGFLEAIGPDLSRAIIALQRQRKVDQLRVELGKISLTFGMTSVEIEAPYK